MGRYGMGRYGMAKYGIRMCMRMYTRARVIGAIQYPIILYSTLSFPPSILLIAVAALMIVLTSSDYFSDYFVRLVSAHIEPELTSAHQTSEIV